MNAEEKPVSVQLFTIMKKEQEFRSIRKAPREMFNKELCKQ